MARRMAAVGLVTVSLRRSIIDSKTPGKLHWKAAPRGWSGAAWRHRFRAARHPGSGGWARRNGAIPRRRDVYRRRGGGQRKNARRTGAVRQTNPPPPAAKKSNIRSLLRLHHL